MSIYYVPDTKCFIIQSHAFSYVMRRRLKKVFCTTFIRESISPIPKMLYAALSHITGNFRSADVFPYREAIPLQKLFHF